MSGGNPGSAGIAEKRRRHEILREFFSRPSTIRVSELVNALIRTEQERDAALVRDTREATLRAERDSLATAVIAYSRHLSFCGSHQGDLCSCARSAALEQARAALAEPRLPAGEEQDG